MPLLLEVTALSSELLVGYGEIIRSHWLVSIATQKDLMENCVQSYQAKLKISSLVFKIIDFDIFYELEFELNFEAQQVLSSQ